MAKRKRKTGTRRKSKTAKPIDKMLWDWLAPKWLKSYHRYCKNNIVVSTVVHVVVIFAIIETIMQAYGFR